MAFLTDVLGFLFRKQACLIIIPFFVLLMIFSVLFVVLGNGSWMPFVYPGF